MSILKKLTEGVVQHSVRKEGAAVLEKWEKTGLLEGLTGDHSRTSMAVMLENQAKQVLKEASSMVQGDVEGYAAVAFPLVRRIFGGLIANDIVSVQPMSLPSGLIFFLDFTYTDTKANAGATSGQSIYGGGRVASQIADGINLTGVDETNHLWTLETGPRMLNNAYSAPTGSVAASPIFVAQRSGSGVWDTVASHANYLALGDALIQHDPDLSGSVVGVYAVSKASFANLNADNLVSVHCSPAATMQPFKLVRRLTRPDPVSGSTQILMVFATYGSGSEDAVTDIGTANDLGGVSTTFTYAVKDGFTAGGALGSVVGTTPWGLEGSPDLLTESGTNIDIPEIDIKIDSIPVTAISRKLKAKWTPELSADLNAYHNLDAEVELTSVLSEQIALEIDQEILEDLRKGATAGTFYWSRKPGKFLNKLTGHDITIDGASLPDFTGNVSEWYETLLETVNDVSAQIHRKTLRGGANFLVTSPEVANILESTAGWRGSVSVDDDRGTAGPQKVASINSKWDVFVDPYFPRNIILIGRKGSSFLESGYVYAPYVPLQVTPTIFGIEDFTPRKAVSTRYAKKMVRPDMYGIVVVADLLFG